MRKVESVSLQTAIIVTASDKEPLGVGCRVLFFLVDVF